MPEVLPLVDIACLTVTKYLLDAIHESNGDNVILRMLQNDDYSHISGVILQQLKLFSGSELREDLLLALSTSRMKSLDINDCQHISSSAITHILQRCSSIKLLNFAVCDDLIGQTFFTSCAEHCSQLTHLTLEGCSQLTDENLQLILTRFQYLEDLNVAQCEKLTDAAFQLPSHQMENPLHSDVKVTPFTRPMTSVCLAFCGNITSLGIYRLVQICGSTLKQLELIGTHVDSSVLLILAGYSLDFCAWLEVVLVEGGLPSSTFKHAATAQVYARHIMPTVWELLHKDFHLRKSKSTIFSTNTEHIHVMDLEDETNYQSLWNDIDELDICDDTGTSSLNHCKGRDSPQDDCHSDSLQNHSGIDSPQDVIDTASPQDFNNTAGPHIVDHTNYPYDNNRADSFLHSQTDGTRTNHVNSQRDVTIAISLNDVNGIDIPHDDNQIQNDNHADCRQDDSRADKQEDDYTDVPQDDNHIESSQDDNYSPILQNLSACHPDCEKSDYFAYSHLFSSSSGMVQDVTKQFLSADSPPCQLHGFTNARQLSGGNRSRSSELIDHDSYLYCGTNSDLYPMYPSILNSLHIRLDGNPIPIVQIVSLILFCLHNPRLTNLKIGAAQQTEENCHYFNVLGENAKQIKKLTIVDYGDIPDDVLERLTSSMKYLEELRINGSSFFSGKALAHWITNSQIRSLHLSECINAVDAELLSLIADKQADHLRVLDISWCEDASVEAVDKMLSVCHELQDLEMRQVNVSRSGLTNLAHSATCLRHINVSGINTLDDDVLHTWAACLPHLRCLNIGWNVDVTDSGVAAILIHCTRLEKLICCGLKRLTSAPLLPIITDYARWPKCKDLLKSKLIYLKLTRGDDDLQSCSNSRDVKAVNFWSHDNMTFSGRSTSYAPYLRDLDLEYCDLVSDVHLDDLAILCRGSLTIINYYAEIVVPTIKLY